MFKPEVGDRYITNDNTTVSILYCSKQMVNYMDKDKIEHSMSTEQFYTKFLLIQPEPEVATLWKHMKHGRCTITAIENGTIHMIGEFNHWKISAPADKFKEGFKYIG